MQALAAAAVFAASGFAASLSAYWNHFGAWAWIPAIAWVARSGVRTCGTLLALFGQYDPVTSSQEGA